MSAATALLPTRTERSALPGGRRITLPAARTDRLFFAQVREDPTLEIETLSPAFDGRIAIVGSG